MVLFLKENDTLVWVYGNSTQETKSSFWTWPDFCISFCWVAKVTIHYCSLFVKVLSLRKRVRSTLGVKWADLVNKGACTLLVRDCPYGSGGECTGYNICFHYHLLSLIWYLFLCRRHRPSNLIEDESRTPSQEFFLSLEREHAKISPQVSAFSSSWVELIRMNC